MEDHLITIQKRLGGQITQSDGLEDCFESDRRSGAEAMVLDAIMEGIRVCVVTRYYMGSGDEAHHGRATHGLAAFAPNAAPKSLLERTKLSTITVTYLSFFERPAPFFGWRLEDPTPFTSRGLKVAPGNLLDFDASGPARSEALGLPAASGYLFRQCVDGVLMASAHPSRPEPDTEQAIAALAALVGMARLGWRPLTREEQAAASKPWWKFW